MQKKINYYTFADNDYGFLRVNMKEGRVFNTTTNIVQNVCEGFLEHLIDCYCTDIDCTAALKTHSLKRMTRFLNDDLTDFEIDKMKVILADGCHFSARCPGDESFLANEEDMKICWEAVEEAKKAVDGYLEKYGGRNFL